jgi:NTE family protein
VAGEYQGFRDIKCIWMKQKVALVLSGGGARGIAHIGVIDELEKRKFEISSVAGTSMGSLIGGVYAAGKLEELKEWIYTLDKGKLLRMVDFTLSKQGLIKGDRVFRKMKDYIPHTNIEDLAIPYAAVAVDLLKKEEVVFREGSLSEAIRASISIPSVFTPVKSKGRLLVDGGVMNNIPINHVHRTEGDILIAVNVIADVPPVGASGETAEEGARKSRIHREWINEFRSHVAGDSSGSHEERMGYFSLITKTIDLMTLQMSNLYLEKCTPDILINVSSESCDIYDFYKIEEMVEAGRLAAVEALDQY